MYKTTETLDCGFAPLDTFQSCNGNSNPQKSWIQSHSKSRRQKEFPSVTVKGKRNPTTALQRLIADQCYPTATDCKDSRNTLYDCNRGRHPKDELLFLRQFRDSKCGRGCRMQPIQSQYLAVFGLAFVTLLLVSSNLSTPSGSSFKNSLSLRAVVWPRKATQTTGGKLIRKLILKK
jgi:hypothetical protein